MFLNCCLSIWSILTGYLWRGTVPWCCFSGDSRLIAVDQLHSTMHIQKGLNTLVLKKFLRTECLRHWEQCYLSEWMLRPFCRVWTEVFGNTCNKGFSKTTCLLCWVQCYICERKEDIFCKAHEVVRTLVIQMFLSTLRGLLGQQSYISHWKWPTFLNALRDVFENACKKRKKKKKNMFLRMVIAFFIGNSVHHWTEVAPSAMHLERHLRTLVIKMFLRG